MKKLGVLIIALGLIVGFVSAPAMAWGLDCDRCTCSGDTGKCVCYNCKLVFDEPESEPEPQPEGN